MQTPPQPTMTEHEQQLFAQFSAQARKQLKQMSKNQLVQTCVALLIDNYGLKGALEQYILQKQEAEATTSTANPPAEILSPETVTNLEAAVRPKRKRKKKDETTPA